MPGFKSHFYHLLGEFKQVTLTLDSISKSVKWDILCNCLTRLLSIFNTLMNASNLLVCSTL